MSQPSEEAGNQAGRELSERTPGETERRISVVVVGAHLEGQPLNHQLTSRGARLVERTTTAARYALFALVGTTPAKPALVRQHDGIDGAAIEVEVWELSDAGFGSFVAEIPAPLGMGSLELSDGRWLPGFICEPWGLLGAVDITHHGGWRGYLDAESSS